MRFGTGLGMSLGDNTVTFAASPFACVGAKQLRAMGVAMLGQALVQPKGPRQSIRASEQGVIGAWAGEKHTLMVPWSAGAALLSPCSAQTTCSFSVPHVFSHPAR